jgi:zinc/manganese transport system substrate-binding protein
MRNFYTATKLTFATLIWMIATAVSAGFAADLKVVASFSIIADIAKNIGGNRLEIHTLVPPNSDTHTYEPRPADAAALREADVILVNGFGLEGFLPRLIKASNTKAVVFQVSDGISAIHGGSHEESDGQAGTHGESYNAHAWQSLRNGRIYVENIRKAFCKADQSACNAYTANTKRYLSQLDELDKQIAAEINSLPAGKRTIITTHEAFEYFERDYGLRFEAPQGVSTEAEASAADVARLVDQIKLDKASAIFIENITNKKLVEQIARETGLSIGGTLYSDALSTTDGPAATYIDMFRYNVKTITTAILGS